jgi:prepilin-type N-terminal cleavage/methylation domain-containing protein
VWSVLLSKLKGFTLLEILVALIICALVVVLTSELLLHAKERRIRVTSAATAISFELALARLRGDVSAATHARRGNKNVQISSPSDDVIKISLFRLAFMPSKSRVGMVQVEWTFEPSGVSRSISEDIKPVKVDVSASEHRIQKVESNVYYLISKVNDVEFAQIVDLR